MKYDIKEVVREKYARAITRSTGCCGSKGGCCGSDPVEVNAITRDLYNPQEVSDMTGLRADILAASFGCGNPTALAELREGEVVLDLGSGAGLDVLLSARLVGPRGKAYGLDMTDEMLAEARANQARAGMENVEFLKGHIEEIPLPDNTVDVIISNCVINLSGDKDRVLREAFRVLKPGGRFAVSDIVVKKPLPAKVRQNMMAWAGCVAGALVEEDYIDKLAAAGFKDIDVEPIKFYDINDVSLAAYMDNLTELERNDVQESVFSAFIRAKKRVL